MSDKKASSTTAAASKENLTWKINYLAAQAGETAHMKSAIIAASRTKYHKIHSDEGYNLETIKQELQNARKQKMETKLHQARKELKNALKKGKTAETQKQIKKIKSSRKLLESTDAVEEGKEAENEKKPKKKMTAEDIAQYEKELEILKQMDLDALVEKTIKNKLQKHPQLKHEQLVNDLVATSLHVEKKSGQQAVDLQQQNIESRLISQSAVAQEMNEIITSFQAIITGHNEKINNKKQEQTQKKKKELEKKRKAEEEKTQKNTKKPKNSSSSSNAASGTSSEFMETLADESEDEEEFKRIYEGEKKSNRVGQRQRRKQWEEMYGREANHVAAEYKKREEKRASKPDYKPKKPTTPKPFVDQRPTAPAEPVHPSWEAKRKQEELMSLALSGKAPAGNKIVFDDSD